MVEENKEIIEKHSKKKIGKHQKLPNEEIYKMHLKGKAYACWK